MEDLNVRLSTVAVDHGMWMQPLFRRDGTMLWPMFDSSPDSHVFIAYQPGHGRQAGDLLEMMEFSPEVDVVRMDHMRSNHERREFVRRIADEISSTGLISSRKTVIVVDGMDSLIGGLRRESTVESVLTDFRRILALGPAAGVHVVLLACADDETVKTVSGLHVAWRTQAIVGSPSQVALESLCPACPAKPDRRLKNLRCAIVMLAPPRSSSPSRRSPGVKTGLVEIHRSQTVL